MSNEESITPEDVPAASSTPAEPLPDPNGPPKPPQGPSTLRQGITAGVCLTAGTVLFAMCSVIDRPCMGVPRSSKLEWQERQQQIQEAWAKDQKSCDQAPADQTSAKQRK